MEHAHQDSRSAACCYTTDLKNSVRFNGNNDGRVDKFKWRRKTAAGFSGGKFWVEKGILGDVGG